MAVFFDDTRIVKGHCRTNSRMPARPLSLTRLRPFTPSAKASGFQFILDVSALKIAKTRRETMRQRSHPPRPAISLAHKRLRTNCSAVI